MKKFISTLLTMALVSLSASATGFTAKSVMKSAPQKDETSEIITEVEGEIIEYEATGMYSLYPDKLTDMVHGDGLGMRVCFDPDGETVYFFNLIPAYQNNAWLKGKILNGIITIPSGQQVDVHDGNIPVLVGGTAFADDGQTLQLVQDMVFQITSDRSSIEQIYPAKVTINVTAYDGDGRVGQIINDMKSRVSPKNLFLRAMPSSATTCSTARKTGRPQWGKSL